MRPIRGADLFCGSGQASARFFVRIGQTGRATQPRDEFTLPLFPLWLIMDAEGLLSEKARQLLHPPKGYGRDRRRARASHNGRAADREAALPAPLTDVDREYLTRCEALIAGAAREFAA